MVNITFVQCIELCAREVLNGRALDDVLTDPIGYASHFAGYIPLDDIALAVADYCRAHNHNQRGVNWTNEQPS